MPDAYANGTYAPFDREFDPDFDAPLDDSLFVDERPLASPWVRLGAVFIDWCILIGAALPGAALLGIGEETGSDVLAGVGGLLIAVVFLGILIYNMVLLTRQGQTIGKRLLKIQIVDKHDGSNPGFGRAVALRSFVPGLIGSVPFLGGFFSLADALMIFSEENQTIHDRMATTVVVSNKEVYGY